MTAVSVSTKKPAAVEADAAVVGLLRGDDGATVAIGDLPRESAHAVEAAAAVLGFAGAVGETLRLPGVDGLEVEQVVLVGLGRAADGEVSPSVIRRATGAALRGTTRAASVLLLLPVQRPEALRAAVEGAALGAYSFTMYKTGAATADADERRNEPPTRVETVLVHSPGKPDRAAREALRQGIATAEATALARDLVNTAPIDLCPATFADRAGEECRSLPVKVTVLDEKQLAKRGYGGLLAVGAGSVRPPRLAILEYSPSRPSGQVALVGKGVTFDSGGLSLKPPNAMPAMKADMGGAAAVLGAVVAAAKLELSVAVTGYLALAENMPSGTAQRPSDVITIHGGRTVEVLNTDAEGRLVLADALVTACEKGPDAVIDVATLTGAQVVALGPRVAGLMGNDDDLLGELEAAAAAAGEGIWRMPLPSHLRAGLDSPVADIANITSKREAGMLVAGVFLREFVGKRDGGSPVPWAHLDIAGPAFNDAAAYDHVPKGGTGSAVGTLLALLEARGR